MASITQPDEVDALHQAIWRELAEPGDWWRGDERMAVAAEVRAARCCPLCTDRLQALSPNGVIGSHQSCTALPFDALEVVHRVATDPNRLTRSWGEARLAALGAGPYAELVAVTAMVVALDVYRVASGEEIGPISCGDAGEPARTTPDGLGDIGAWVPMTTEKALANVSRALTSLPVTNRTWRRLVNDSYSRGPEMLALTWERALSRPQIELIAARVSTLNECFY